MSVIDEWEKDPAVQTMRRIFVQMEEVQKSFLSALGIDHHDPRLRGWREKALSRFERSWRIASGKNLKLSEQRMAVVYLHCLAAQMRLDGVSLDKIVLQSDKEIEALVKESGE